MAQHDSLLLYLHQSFVRFTGKRIASVMWSSLLLRQQQCVAKRARCWAAEVLTTEANCWEACKIKLGELQKEWQDKGLYG